MKRGCDGIIKNTFCYTNLVPFKCITKLVDEREAVGDTFDFIKAAYAVPEYLKN